MDQAIEAVLKGQYFVTSLLTREIVTGLSSEEGGMFFAAARPHATAARGAAAHCRRRTIKEIAALLNISPKPWSSTRPKSFPSQSVMTAELTKYALAHGLTSA